MVSLTSESKLIVGGSGWAADLTKVFGGATLSDTVNVAADEGVGNYWSTHALTSYDQSINVPTLYTDGEGAALLTRKEGYVFLVEGADDGTLVGWDGGLARWTGLPSTAPVEDFQSHSVTFLTKESWYEGVGAVAFNFENSPGSVDLPNLSTGQRVFVVTTAKSAGNRTGVISDGASSANRENLTIANPGVMSVVDTWAAPAANSSATFTMTLTSGQNAAGYVLIGQERTVA